MPARMTGRIWSAVWRFCGVCTGRESGWGHRFDIRERIDFYESLCRGHGGVLFEDYDQVRGWMNWLMDTLDRMEMPECICHIDANVDNFLFLADGDVKLLDWEYAGMCNPIMDISMCAIYSY